MLDGRMLLFEDQGESVKELGRLQLDADDGDMYTHPAIVDTRIYLRVGRTIVCLELAK